jgi:cytochrome P450
MVMTLVTDLDLPVLDLGVPEQIHQQVEEALEAGHWLMRIPFGVTVIEHNAVRDLHKDSRLESMGARVFAMQGVHGGPAYERFSRSLVNLQGEEHTRLRRLVSRAFTPRAVDRLRPMMRAWVDERARAMAAAGGGDAVADLTEAYPIAVICELAGVPAWDWPKFSAWSRDIFRMFAGNLVADLPVIEAAQAALDDYVDTLIEQRRAGEPRDDLIADLMRVEEEGDRLTHREMRQLVNAIITGGTETTRNQLGLALMTLASHPSEWERLVADPDLVPRAVEEVLRVEPTTAATTRIATTDVEYRGVAIPAGTFVALSTGAANRDPAHVSCPSRFDVSADREGWGHLTFGAGIHYCLGANLVRAELQEALGVLVRRWRRVELVSEPEMKPGIYGPTRLPVRIEAR